MNARTRVILLIIALGALVASCGYEVVSVEAEAGDFPVDVVHSIRGEDVPFIRSDDFGPRPETLYLIFDVDSVGGDPANAVSGMPFTNDGGLKQAFGAPEGVFFGVLGSDLILVGPLEEVVEHLGPDGGEVGDELRAWVNMQDVIESLGAISITASGGSAPPDE